MKKQPEPIQSCAWVAGATGYTGKHLTEILCRAGESVVAHIRPNSRSLSELSTHFEGMGAVVDTTPWGSAEFATAMKKHGVTHIFSLLGTTKAKAREAKREGFQADYEAVDRDMTLECLAAATQLETPPVFVYLSAAGVSSSSRSPYMRVRWEVEERLRGSGIPYIIAHPALITGADRREHRPMERVGDFAMRGVFGLARGLGAGKWADQYATLNGETLARGLIGASKDRALWNQTVGVPDLLRVAF